ncbi:MAG: enhanced intracellular survival protein Eis [Haloarculaceae archaeon]
MTGGTRTFRRLRAEEHRAFQRFVDYAFSPEEGPTRGDTGPEAESEGEESGEERQGERYGVFADGELASVCVHYDFEAHLRDAWVPTSGLAAVATPPERRHRGHVRFMVAESLDRWRGEYPLTALWPFSREYYGQFGWATANRNVSYDCPPEALSAARDDRVGRFRPVDADEWADLQPLHETHAADRTLTLRRDEAWWRERVFSSLHGEDRHVYAYERDGEVAGYLAYSFESTGEGLGDRTLRVNDLAYADHGALCQVLGFLGDHDSQAESVTLVTEPSAPMLDVVPEPDDVEATVHGGPMVRVVDAAHALSTLTYPDDATGDLTIAVSDGTAPWNDATFRLRVADGEGDCTRIEGSSVDIDASLDVGTLSQLVVGYHDVATARHVGGLTVADDGVAGALRACFPEGTPYLRTFF